MENKSILLSIGVPTYNRADSLKRQLSFLYSELMDLSDEEKSRVSITVRDNCSSDKTREVVSSSLLFSLSIVKCSYYINPQTLGLEGNLNKLYSTLEGEYLWIIGDDDSLKKGILRIVFDECKERCFSYIFVNHTITKNNSVVCDSVLADIDVNRKDKAALWDLYNKSGTVMMLISACIYRSDLVKDYLLKYGIDLIIPCSLSFYCASRGDIRLIGEPFLKNDQSEISWEKSLDKVFYFLIPSLMLRMPSWGYNKKECIREYIRIKKKYIKRIPRVFVKKVLNKMS